MEVRRHARRLGAHPLPHRQWGDAHAGLRKLLRHVAAVQWDEDELVKFSQVDIDREKVTDLFIDVHADRLIVRDQRTPDILTREPLGGAAEHLLKIDVSSAMHLCTLLRGAPGQGKSMLSQFICQAHRSAFVAAEVRPANLPIIERPLFPIRLNLSEYARWMAGFDCGTSMPTYRRSPRSVPQQRRRSSASWQI